MTLQSLTPQPKYDIKFSQNWNNKLYCEYFTTIRVEEQGRYAIGDVARILLQTQKQQEKKPYIINIGANTYQYLYNAMIIDTKILLLEQLPEFSAYLDTGRNAYYTKKLIRSLMPNTDFKQTKIIISLLKKL